MKILAFGAHPDDIELGCAGTLLQYAKQGHDVYLYVLTTGQEAGDPDVRKKEQVQAASLIGAKELMWGGLDDTRIVADKKTISQIDDVVQKILPDEVFVNYPKDSHQDHRALAQCVISATRYIKRVLYYSCWWICICII